MKKIYQLSDKKGNPLGGRVFIAPDEASLEASVRDATPEGVVFTEVGTEDEIVSPAVQP